jgi:hypothetical protein
MPELKSNPFYNFYDTYFEFRPEFNQISNKAKTKTIEFLLANTSKYNWTTFIDNIIKVLKKQNAELDASLDQKRDNDLKIQVLKAWKQCTMCRTLFARASKLMTYNCETYTTNSIMFTGDDYPLEMGDAITKLKRYVETRPLENEIVFGFHDSGSTKLSSIYSGEEEHGDFEHIRYIKTTQNCLTKGKMLELNTIFKDSLITFTQITNIWIHHTNALQCIQNAYTEKGTCAPGYQHYAHAVTWFLEFINNLKDIEDESDVDKRINKIRVQCLVEALKLMIDMRCATNVVAMFSTFSPKSNLYECQTVTTPDQFWKLLGARMNPTEYRKRTAAPKAQTVERMIKKIGAKELEEMYQRETWDINDPRLKKWLYYKREGKEVSSGDHTLTIGQLRAKTKKKQSTKPTNCFSNSSVKQTTYKLNDFNKFLTTLPPGTDIEWRVSDYNKIQYAFPCNEIGRKPLKRESNWGLNTGIAKIYDYDHRWVKVDAIGSHASTWKSSYPEPIKEAGYGEGEHTTPLLNNGITIVVSKEDRDKVSGYNWTLNSNALFAEFFEGMYEYESIRGTYHRDTKIKSVVENPYEGAFINRAQSSQKDYFQYGISNSQYGNVLEFKIDGVVYTVY